MIDPFVPAENAADYHSSYSIQLCELVDAGFDPFGDSRWKSLDWYDDATRERLERKIKLHYWFREIGITPPGPWRIEFTRVMAEILPKYKPLYAELAKGITPLAASDVYEKERHVYSDFPATQLNAEVNDYARTADDREIETVSNGDFITKANEISNRYNDVDRMIIDELEVVFSCMMSVSLNLL